MQAAESIIHINLLPLEEQSARRRFAPARSSVLLLAAVAVVMTLVAVLSVVQSLQVRTLRAEIDELHIAARESQALIQRINTLTAEREAVRSRLQVIEQLDTDRFVRVRLTDELSRRLPEQVWLTSFRENDGLIEIQGVTFSNLSVAELIDSLERSVLYQNVDLAVSRRGTIEEHEVVNFTIRAIHQVSPKPGENTAG